MPARIPTRDPIGRATPRRIYEFGEFIGKRLVKQNKAAQAAHTSSGLISGSKLGNPTLWSVLDLLGFDKDFDEFTLGKFQRGHDVEARAINFMTDIPIQTIIDILDGTVPNPGWITLAPGALLSGEVHLQYQTGYRGGVGYVDLAQKNNGNLILHEVKSVTKMAYDKVAASGRSKDGVSEPYYHHCIQQAFYALGEGTSSAFVHYFNADDYRLCSFALNPLDYKDEIDKEIDDIQAAFITKVLPPFEALLPFHKIKNYQKYGDEWNLLTPSQMLVKLQNEYPEAYNKFMTITLPTGDTHA
jgi:hypothetical protein